MTTSLMEVSEVQTFVIDNWRDQNAVNKFLEQGWVILQTAPGTSEYGDSYIQMLMGRSSKRSVA